MATRSRGIGYSTGTATTTEADIAIPVSATSVKIVVTADCLVTVGNDDSPPTLDTSNSAIVTADFAEVWAVDPRRDVDTHLYIASATGTADYTISFYG